MSGGEEPTFSQEQKSTPGSGGRNEQEIPSGSRFRFGENWRRYLEELDEARIHEAEQSVKEMLELEGLQGKRFLDVGCGSGLFSLVARRLGAEVRSFDYDPQAVICAEELKRYYFPDDPVWIIEKGSILDADYVKSLGRFDIVYSWGVLHHTGDMWNALANIVPAVAPDGLLFIAIYNDQGRASRYWLWVKQAYNTLPKGLRFLVLYPAFLRLWGATFVRDLLQGRPCHAWSHYSGIRGMSPWRDVVDWVGGYPFEVATPEQIFDFFRKRGFVLRRLKTCAGGLGCNEFIFHFAPGEY